METLEGRVTRHARIDAIKARVQQALKRSIDKQEALAPEKLGLDLEESKVTKNKPQRDNAKYWAKAESKRTKQENHVSSHFQTIPRQDDPAQRTWCPPAAPSYQPLPIPALRSDQHVLSSQPRQTFDPYAYRSPAPLVRYQPSQGFNPIKGSSRAAIHPIAQFVPITIPLRDTASAFENKSGPGPTVQKSSMSVSTYRRIPPPRIDKYSRYSKAHDPPDPKQVQLGRWTGSPATKVQQFVPATSKPLKSTHVKGMETSAPQIKTKATHWKKSNDIPLIYLPAPVPTPAYLTMAHATATVLTSPQRLLLVLDLNGTLLYRPKTSQNYTPRPSLEAFLNYAFTNHSILIWSSATPYNVTSICARLFNAKRRQLLLGEWGRDTLGLTAAQYKERVQVYKRLDTIWDSEVLQASHPGFHQGERWGQHNTLLIDDSMLKASAQPFNYVEVPQFVKGGGEKEGDGKDVFAQLVGYLEKGRRWNDVSAFVRQMRFKIDAGWSWEWGGKKKGSQQAPIVTDDDRIDEDVDVDEDEDKDEDQDGGVSL